jgi:hypothetical protein
MKTGLTSHRLGARDEYKTEDDKITMNKRHICGVILALLAGSAHADDINGDGVTLYGILDVAVGTVEHSANGTSQGGITVNPEKVPTAYPHSVTGMFNGVFRIPAGGFVVTKTWVAGCTLSSTWNQASICRPAKSTTGPLPLPVRTIRPAGHRRSTGSCSTGARSSDFGMIPTAVWRSGERLRSATIRS